MTPVRGSRPASVSAHSSAAAGTKSVEPVARRRHLLAGPTPAHRPPVTAQVQPPHAKLWSPFESRAAAGAGRRERPEVLRQIGGPLRMAAARDEIVQRGYPRQHEQRRRSGAGSHLRCRCRGGPLPPADAWNRCERWLPRAAPAPACPPPGGAPVAVAMNATRAPLPGSNPRSVGTVASVLLATQSAPRESRARPPRAGRNSARGRNRTPPRRARRRRR